MYQNGEKIPEGLNKYDITFNGNTATLDKPNGDSKLYAATENNVESGTILKNVHLIGKYYLANITLTQN